MNRNPTPEIANRIEGRVFFRTFMECAPDYESPASLIAGMPPRLAATEVGMGILVLLRPGRVLPCRASPNDRVQLPAALLAQDPSRGRGARPVSCNELVRRGPVPQAEP